MQILHFLRHGVSWIRASVLVLLLLLGLVIILGTGASERTYYVEASTWGGEITFQREGNDWLILQGTICAPLEVPDLRATGHDDQGPCPATLFKPPKDIVSEVISWQPGTRIHFSEAPDGRFIVRTLNSETASMPVDSRLVIPAAVWRRHGALVFSGNLRLGGAMGTGAQDYLTGGFWEARQMGFATSLFRDITEVVQRGELSRGASVEVVGKQGAVISYGHITRSADEAATGFDVVALTERGNLSLEVRYFGLSNPIRYRPDWMDTISASPMLIALAALLTFLLTMLQLIIAILFPGRER